MIEKKITPHSNYYRNTLQLLKLLTIWLKQIWCCQMFASTWHEGNMTKCYFHPYSGGSNADRDFDVLLVRYLDALYIGHHTMYIICLRWDCVCYTVIDTSWKKLLQPIPNWTREIKWDTAPQNQIRFSSTCHVIFHQIPATNTDDICWQSRVYNRV